MTKDHLAYGLPHDSIRFILPNPIEGDRLAAIRECELTVSAASGGYTRTLGHRAWRHPDLGLMVEEEVRIYDVAVDGPDTEQAVLQAAYAAAQALGEHSMFWRDSYDDTRIITVVPADASR